MKVQQIGMVLGMNVVAACCLMMQGCKATKPGAGVQEPSPVVVAPEPEPAPVIDVKPLPPAPAPVIEAPAAPKARTVKPLPPPPPPAKQAVKPLPPPPPPAGESFVYTVRRGDSLSKISKRYNVKMGAIVAANPGLNPDKIRIGRKLNIPGSEPVVAAAAPAKKSAAVLPAAAPAANLQAPVKTRPAFKPYTGATKDYTVKNGDSLGKIAKESGISIRALKELNGLRKDFVRQGQVLKVPAEKVVAKESAKKAPAAAAKPAGEKKDAAAVKPAAAEKKDAAKPAPEKKDAAAETKAADAPAADAAKPAVETPEVKAADAPAAEAAKPAAETADAMTHTVKEGEDIVGIAIQYAISPSQLMELNNLKVTDTPKPGQVLKLPTHAKAQ